MNPVQIIVQLNPDGTVQVTGPIENEIFCFGLLDKAKLAIAEHNKAKAAATAGIVRANAMPAGLPAMPKN